MTTVRERLKAIKRRKKTLQDKLARICTTISLFEEVASAALMVDRDSYYNDMLNIPTGIANPTLEKTHAIAVRLREIDGTKEELKEFEDALQSLYSYFSVESMATSFESHVKKLIRFIFPPKPQDSSIKGIDLINYYFRLLRGENLSIRDRKIKMLYDLQESIITLPDDYYRINVPDTVEILTGLGKEHVDILHRAVLILSLTSYKKKNYVLNNGIMVPYISTKDLYKMISSVNKSIWRLVEIALFQIGFTKGQITSTGEEIFVFNDKLVNLLQHVACATVNKTTFPPKLELELDRQTMSQIYLLRVVSSEFRVDSHLASWLCSVIAYGGLITLIDNLLGDNPYKLLLKDSLFLVDVITQISQIIPFFINRPEWRFTIPNGYQRRRDLLSNLQMIDISYFEEV